MSRSNTEEQEMIYMMPNGRPVVVRNQGQSHQETRNRKTNKLYWSMITVAIIIIFTLLYSLTIEQFLIQVLSKVRHTC